MTLSTTSSNDHKTVLIPYLSKCGLAGNGGTDEIIINILRQFPFECHSRPFCKRFNFDILSNDNAADWDDGDGNGDRDDNMDVDDTDHTEW